MKNTLNMIIRELDSAEENISELEDIEFIQAEAHRGIKE